MCVYIYLLYVYTYICVYIYISVFTVSLSLYIYVYNGKYNIQCNIQPLRNGDSLFFRTLLLSKAQQST